MNLSTETSVADVQHGQRSGPTWKTRSQSTQSIASESAKWNPYVALSKSGLISFARIAFFLDRRVASFAVFLRETPGGREATALGYKASAIALPMTPSAGSPASGKIKLGVRDGLVLVRDGSR